MTNEEMRKELEEIERMIAEALKIDHATIEFIHIFDGIDENEFQDFISAGVQLIELEEIDLCNLCHSAPAVPHNAFGYCGDCAARMN